MTGICYNDKDAYANLGYNNWPSEDPTVGVLPVYAMLLTAAYTPNADAGGNGVKADIVASESSATGYTAGGQAVTITNTIATNAEDYIAGREPLWTIGEAGATTLVCRYVAYYILGSVTGADGVARTNPLIAYQKLDQTYTVAPGAGNTQTFKVRENSAVVGAVTAIPKDAKIVKAQLRSKK
jgi:hypothetical protein